MRLLVQVMAEGQQLNDGRRRVVGKIVEDAGVESECNLAVQGSAAHECAAELESPRAMQRLERGPRATVFECLHDVALGDVTWENGDQPSVPRGRQERFGPCFGTLSRRRVGPTGMHGLSRAYSRPEAQPAPPAGA